MVPGSSIQRVGTDRDLARVLTKPYSTFKSRVHLEHHEIIESEEKRDKILSVKTSLLPTTGWWPDWMSGETTCQPPFGVSATPDSAAPTETGRRRDSSVKHT